MPKALLPRVCSFPQLYTCLKACHCSQVIHTTSSYYVESGKTQEALQKLHKGLQQWPKNGYMALLAANLEAKQGRTDNARKMYAVAAAHALSTIALQV